MKTRSLKASEITKDWYIADAEGKTLGRFASEIAKVLRGKHKPTFTRLDHMRRTHPERIVEKAVWGMLPKNRLGRAIINHLKVYAGADHPHAAQQPKELDI